MSANPPDIEPVASPSTPNPESPLDSSPGPTSDSIQAPTPPVNDQVTENNKLAAEQTQTDAETAAKASNDKSSESTALQAEDKAEIKQDAPEQKKAEANKPNQQEQGLTPMAQLANDLMDNVSNNTKALWEAVKRPVEAVKGIGSAVESKVSSAKDEIKDTLDGLSSTKDFLVGVGSAIKNKISPVALSPAEDTKVDPKQGLSDEKSSGYDSAAQTSTSTPSPTVDTTKDNEQDTGPKGP